MLRPIEAFHAASNLAEGANITAFAATSNGLQIAVGFSTGSIVLFTASLLADGSPSRQHVPQILIQQHKTAVSDLYFCEPFNNSNSARNNSDNRYVSFINNIVRKINVMFNNGNVFLDLL
jgi:hypothetical protein